MTRNDDVYHKLQIHVDTFKKYYILYGIYGIWLSYFNRLTGAQSLISAEIIIDADVI